MNKIFHNKIKGFIRNKKGAVSIEFFFFNSFIWHYVCIYD